MKPDENLDDIDLMARALHARIMNVLPAATYHMDHFLRLVDVIVSDRVETAAMECGPQPRMLLNAAFVEKFCQRDEHLLMLIMHELYHLILGHTKIFPRISRSQNIAFDALINAKLCHQFKDPVFIDFFCALNRADQFPSRILRPPVGWPFACKYEKGISHAERKVMKLLYEKPPTAVTYGEILDLLNDESEKQSRPSGDGKTQPGADGCVLLGDHDNNGSKDAEAMGDQLTRDIIIRTVQEWPKDVDIQKGRDSGDSTFATFLPTPQTPRGEFVKALRRLLLRAGILNPGQRTDRSWQAIPTDIETMQMLPNWRDRSLYAREALIGKLPIFYRSQNNVIRPQWRPRHMAHVYIDVSGSMDDCLPWLIGGLAPLHDKGLCRIYAFSTIVAEVGRGCLRKNINTTRGTDINCVIEHLLAVPRHRAPRKVVVLTDGDTGYPDNRWDAEFYKRKIELYVGLIGGDAMGQQLKSYAKSMEDLPDPISTKKDQDIPRHPFEERHERPPAPWESISR